MNDKLQQLYNLYKQKGIISTTDFNTFASADENQRQKLYDIGVQKGLFNTTDFNTFNNAWGGEKKSVASAAKAGALEASKKKDSTVLDSKSGKPTSVSSSNANKIPTIQELNKGITWVGNEKEQQKYLKSNEGTSDYSKARKIGDELYEGEGEIFTNYPGKEGKAYRYYNKQWYEYSSTIPGKNGDITQLKKPITDPTRISNLNKEFNKEGTTEKGVYIGFPQKEQNEYKVVNGQWKKRTPENRTWVTVTNEGSISALNRQFKQNVSKISDENLLKQIKEDNGYSLYFDKALNKIDTKLISKSEEEVVAELNGIFPVGSGWKFEQHQAGADRIQITAPNGQREVFILDNWSTSEDKSQAIKMRTWMAKNNLTPSEYERNKELKKKLSEEQRFTGPTSLGDREAMEAQDVVMRQNLATELGLKPNLTEEEAMMLQKVKTAKAEAKPARLEVLTEKSRKAAEIQEQYKEYLLDPSNLSQSKIIEARQALAALAQDKSTIAQASRFVDDINERSKAYKQEFDIVESQIKNSATELVNKYKSGQITYDEYLLEFKALEKKTKEIQGELKLKESEIQNQIKLSDKIASQANQSLGENYALKQEAGSFGGAMTLGFIKGAASPFRLLGGVMGEGMTSAEWHKAVSDAVSPFWDYQTSLEYIRSQEHSDLYKAAFSVSESLGAMAPAVLTGGSTALGTSLLARGAAGTATFFPLMYYELKDEMENVDMPESHKMLLASLYGVIGGAMESFGMEYAMGKINSTVGANIKRNILKNVLGKTIPRNAPREFIDALVQTETRAYLSSLGLGVLESGAVEGVTEGLQSLTGASIQEIYDRIGNKTELFNNQGLQEVFSTALYETYLGALGGKMVSTVYSAGSAMNRGAILNSEELSTLMAAAKTNGMSETLMTNLKADILNQRMTLEQAKEIANNFKLVQSKVNEIPENLTVEAQSVSLGLLMERENLNQQIEGKDPNLVKPLKERVNEINNRLQELSTDYAVQEQSTGEVPVQPTTGVGTEMEERIPETRPQEVTREVVGEQTEGQQAETAVAQEERQSLIDQFVQDEIDIINTTYVGVPQEEKQAALDKLAADPISYATELEGMPRADNFLSSLEKQAAREALPVAQPTERIEFTQENLPVELQNVEPVGTTTTRRGIFGMRKGKTVLTYTGQQLIDAGLRKAPKAVQPLAETATTEVVAPQAAPITIEPKLEAQLNKLYDKQESGKPLTPKQQQFVEKNQKAYDQIVSSRTLQEQASALDALISGQTQGPAFQLQEEGKGQELKERKEKIKERKEDLVEKATKEMERVQPEIADEAYETQEPTKGTVQVEIKENEPLTEGIPRKSIKDFIGKKINLLMADLLKVDLNNKIKKMGGVFFPLIPGLRGKIAWASIDLEAAKRIVRGAIKSQFSMVYNMNPEAMMSNKVFLESVLDRISNLPNANVVFNQMMERIQGLSYQTDTEQIHKVARESKTMAEFKKNFAELNVDQKAAIMRSILPEQGTDYSGSKIGVFKTLSNEGITKESMIEENVEQFAADLPPGALTMVLEIVDENGNRPTEETIDNFILTREQAEEMGLPIHENYPIYIKGKVNSILTETTSFWDVLKDFKRSVDAKIANLIQKKDTYIVEREVTDKKGNKQKVDVAVKVYNNPNGTRTVEVFNSTEVKGEGKKTTIDALEKEGTDLFISANIGKIKSYKEGGLYTAKEARSSTMRSASMKADSAFEVTESTKSKYQQFVERLTKAFPTVEVATSQEEFDAMIDEIKSKAVGNKVLLTKNQNVYGAVYNGKLYLNPNLENYNTPIHEFGHIWLNVAKTMRTDLYNKGLSLIRNSEYLNDVKNSPEYNRIVKAMQAQGFSEQEIEQYLEEEALATAIGDKGESFVTAATKRSFNNWLNNVFDFVKKLTGISNVTSEQLQDMTLDEFVQGVVVDLMSENQQFKDAEIESFGNQLQLMTGPAGLSMQDIISMGRAYGFTDAAIKQSLLNQGFRATEINNMLAVQLNLVESMPTAFANVDGGMTVGLQMYNDVKQELEDYSRGETTTTRAPRMTKQERTARIAELRKQNPTLTELSDSELLRRFPRPAQAATTTTTRPTLSEIRAKAMELIKAHPTFQAQKETVQMELLSAFDKTLGTRANKVIQQQINAIRNNLKQRKIGAKELQDAKVVLRNFIKNVLPKSETYSSVDVNKLLNLIAKSTEATIMKDTNTVLDIVEKQREKMKTNVIRDMFTMVAKKGKVGKTTTGKRRSAGLEEKGQAFFEAAKGILKAVIKGNTTFLDAVKQELNAAEQDGRMLSAINASVNGEKLTVKEQDLLNKAQAYDMFINLNDMQLEEVQDVFSFLKGMRSQSIMDLASKRLQRAAEYMAINEQATEQVQKLNPVLFREQTDENGDVKMIPKNQNELNRDKKEVFEFIRKGRIGKAIKSARKNWNFKSPSATKRFFNNYMKHLGTMMNMFDNKAKGMTFFTDNVYKPLNRMDESAKRGYQNQVQVLNSIANTVNGITKGYKQIRNMVQSKPFFTVQDKNGNIDRFTMEQVLRIYALSKNNVQREILRKQGITDSVLDSMVKALPSPAVEFADKVVDYLSNQYYESVNDVYSSVNDINLGRVENYFPTAKVDPNKAIDFNPEDPNFSGIFNAETAPSLHERVDNKSDIDLNHDFFDVLDNHMNNMERYKAYAEGVKKLNAVFQNENVSAMLNGTKTKALVKNLINYAITPNFGLSQQDTIVGKIMNKFTGFALAFKLVQIPKQASSFVQAFEDYSYFGKDSKVPRVIRKPIDVLGFMVDTAITAATIRSTVKELYSLSANLRDRLEKGIQGDVYSLESGARLFRPIDKRSDAYGKIRRGVKSAAAAPTVIGDVLGVMGYAVNYRRNIKNGMSQEEALEAFTDYNATQQTRRGTERNMLQNNKSELIRVFTMFGSTSFLMLNKVMQANHNIKNSLLEKQMPESKDMRALVLNLGAANAFFVLAANLAKYALGDDDDKEAVIDKMKKAMYGFNLIAVVPFINETFQEVSNYIEGTQDPSKMGTNPFMSVWWKILKGLKEEDVIKAMQPLVELGLGTQIDPFIGLYNILGGDFEQDDVFDMLGISKSYRPTPNELREEMTKEGYSPEEIEQAIQDDKYMKAMDSADKKLNKELNKIDDMIDNGEITEKEYNELYQEIEDEYEETLKEIEEEFSEE